MVNSAEVLYLKELYREHMLVRPSNNVCIAADALKPMLALTSIHHYVCSFNVIYIWIHIRIIFFQVAVINSIETSPFLDVWSTIKVLQRWARAFWYANTGNNFVVAKQRLLFKASIQKPSSRGGNCFFAECVIICICTHIDKSSLHAISHAFHSTNDCARWFCPGRSKP